MDSFRIQGGRRLAGRIQIEGSKNATLPLMAAALCTDGTLTLRNVPCLSDISNMTKLLRELGVEKAKRTQADQRRICDHLRKRGWVNKLVKERGEVQRYWTAPGHGQDLADA
jgi:UDP-N-acetylglucosamine enolpyruvyl transferase